MASRKATKAALGNFPARPQRPYSSFADFVQKNQRPWLKRPYHCFRCGGSGKVVPADEWPLLVEGHKMSRRVACPACGGTGLVGEGVWRREYRSRVSAWRCDLADWKRANARRRAAIAKLDDDELRALELS